MPGRKLVVWLGIGGPSGVQLTRTARDLRHPDTTQPYQRMIADLLMDARITLDVIGPGGDAPPPAVGPTAVMQNIERYRFENGLGFSGYIASTGGQWKNGNDTVTGVVGNTRDMELNNTEALSVYY